MFFLVKAGRIRIDDFRLQAVEGLVGWLCKMLFLLQFFRHEFMRCEYECYRRLYIHHFLGWYWLKVFEIFAANFSLVNETTLTGTYLETWLGAEFICRPFVWQLFFRILNRTFHNWGRVLTTLLRSGGSNRGEFAIAVARIFSLNFWDVLRAFVSRPFKDLIELSDLADAFFLIFGLLVMACDHVD